MGSMIADRVRCWCSEREQGSSAPDEPWWLGDRTFPAHQAPFGVAAFRSTISGQGQRRGVGPLPGPTGPLGRMPQGPVQISWLLFVSRRVAVQRHVLQGHLRDGVLLGRVITDSTTGPVTVR
jgi:hypothetical protein